MGLFKGNAGEKIPIDTSKLILSKDTATIQTSELIVPQDTFVIVYLSPLSGSEIHDACISSAMAIEAAPEKENDPSKRKLRVVIIMGEGIFAHSEEIFMQTIMDSGLQSALKTIVSKSQKLVFINEGGSEIARTIISRIIQFVFLQGDVDPIMYKNVNEYNAEMIKEGKPEHIFKGVSSLI